MGGGIKDLVTDIVLKPVDQCQSDDQGGNTDGYPDNGDKGDNRDEGTFTSFK